MSAAKRSKKPNFLSGYRMAEDTLLEPDSSSGRPGIWPGTDEDGRSILVKFWPAQSARIDRDLEEIWRSEIRQLHTLGALPEANDLIVRMIANGRDSTGFYLVLDAGEGVPLAVATRRKNLPKLLATSRTAQTRATLWQNFRRIIRGLDLLHSQGAIHRNIDPWSIISNFTNEPDFRLTGFEWSMRIAATTTSKKGVREAPRRRPASSFAGDWYDLALVMAQVLDIPAERLVDMNVVPSSVVDHASAIEIRLLRTMLGLLHIERLDGEQLLGQVEEIINFYGSEAAGKDAKFHIALRLGETSKLTRKIRAASDFSIETTELAEQIDFVFNDISENASFIACKSEVGDVLTYYLCGQHLNYRLRPYRTPGSDDQTWDFATCDDAETDPPLSWLLESSIELTQTQIDFSEWREAAKLFPTMRGKVSSWESLIRRGRQEATSKSPVEQVHQAMCLLLLLELAYAAADIFPVVVAPSRGSEIGGEVYRISVSDVLDDERLELAEALKLEPPATRLKRLFESDDLKEEGAWALLEAGELGERTGSTSWRIVELPSQATNGWFALEGFQAPQVTGRAYLTPSATAGTIVQLKRRLKALSALFRHKELLEMLADPRGRIENSQDPLDTTSAEFKELDGSKQKALAEILATIPLFLLQGPPGVGKTFLTADIVRRRFADDATSRLLLSAQSNSALDHLLDEVHELFKGEDDGPLIVRARSPDGTRSAGDVEVGAQADNLISDLYRSSLLSEGSPSVQERVRSLVGDVTHDRTSSQARQRRRTRTSSDRRALESMILRSANLVFATTNSAAVETLIEERGYFDWTIVEEAGKATGTELISPLLLSYRRLMIGDHKQLPPFDIDRISRLLKVPSDVQKAIAASSDLISRYMRDALLDDVIEEIESGVDSLDRACADALVFLTLFGSFVERDFRRTTERPTLRPIARRLNEQHRMHPAIARIVSKCFYDDRLATFPATAAKFQGTPAVRFAGNVLQGKPVTFIDMPYSRTAPQGTDFAESRPVWSNVEEAKATMRVLSLLSPSNPEQRPSLAVLSPYREQMKLLRSMLGERVRDDLTNIRGFKPGVANEEYCGTVDSFQGGEADCVVISLVRNNTHTNPFKALGFLTKSERMNVLLSRARWKLILVGSLRFYKHIIDSSTTESEEMKFFKSFYETLLEGTVRGEVEVIEVAKI
ncbi:DNA helicase, UvrD/REP family (plasmid) [Sinorhizobium americanum CCGM7]|uniref:AAA domain-containing protein n=1 Tax=Sinorhizobium americanum TaxID=194963 RepID=UPI0004D8D16D|nr:AAA domain-containing protein [Sinorhizobium americanum]APG87341.1 DNA helicase, UvrD/REP family [Sinorhizobium americanum CCGM7]